MGQASHQERRRLESLRRQKERSVRRHEEGAFLGAVREAVKRGWCLGGLAAHCETGEAEDFRDAVKSLFGASGIQLASRRSWTALIDAMASEEAPDEAVAAVVEKWRRARPDDPDPLVLKAGAHLLRGEREEAQAAIDEAGVEVSAREAAMFAATRFSSLRGLDGQRWKHSDFVLRPREWAERPRGLAPPAARSSARGRPSRESPRSGGKDAASGRSSPAPRGGGPSAPETPPRSGRAPALCPAPLSVAPEVDESLLERLLRGPHDDAEGLDLVRRGVGVLAAEQFDSLLALSTLRGVDHLGYQIETVQRVLKRFHGRVLLADEVGLGKTIEAGLVLKEYLVRGQVRRALILVPAALVGQWQAELEGKFGIEARTTQEPAFRASPETFWSLGQVLVASLPLARSAPHRDRLLAERFDLVIVDEAHHLKNRSTRGWELVNGLRSRFFLMLTATPVETDLAELYNLITLLRPGTLGTETDFRRRFVRTGDPTQPRDPERLRELLRDVMIRNTRAVCGLALPPRTARTLVVPPAAQEQTLYQLVIELARRHPSAHRSLLRQLLEEAGSSPRAVAETAAKALETGVPAEMDADLRRVEDAARSTGPTAKLERLTQLVAGDKVLVFSRFRATLREIAEHLRDRGVAFATFTGGMSSAEKDRAVDLFAAGGTDVLLCSEIGGEGRNLQFCHRLINFDLPWNPMKIEQRIGRIHRLGQTETVEVVNLAGAGTAEEKILDVLDRRVNLFELVIGEMDMVLGSIEDQGEFGEEVFDIYARSQREEEVDLGFEALAGKLLEGRQRLERTKALDRSLFGEGYAV